MSENFLTKTSQSNLAKDKSVEGDFGVGRELVEVSIFIREDQAFALEAMLNAVEQQTLKPIYADQSDLVRQAIDLFLDHYGPRAMNVKTNRT